MGLDIYLRYGEIETDEEGYADFVGWEHGGKYESEYKAQITGFTNAPEAGYLRESWPSLTWVRGTAERLNAPYPYDFWPEWNGYNGEELRVDAERLLQIQAFKRTLSEWLYSPERTRERNAVTGDEAANLVAFFKRCLDVTTFLSLVEARRGEKNLTIVFG